MADQQHSMARGDDGFANFKGVMLCSRPVDKSQKRNLDPKFISTVTGRSEMGVNPAKLKPRRERKRSHPDSSRRVAGFDQPQEMARVAQVRDRSEEENDDAGNAGRRDEAGENQRERKEGLRASQNGAGAPDSTEDLSELRTIQPIET